jgi:Domain of unknown function (DUF1707)
MPAPTSPTWLLNATRRRAGHGDLRISDAERAEVSDLLSKHYGDGRLDQAEFNERLDQAMKAKTYSDLSGLFADLPSTDAETPEASRTMGAIAQHRHRRLPHRALLLILVVVIAALAGHALVFALTPWVWIGLLAVIAVYVLRSSGGRL